MKIEQSLIDQLDESLGKLEKMQDDYRAEFYDQADEMDLGRWHQIDLENEREQMTEAALDACLKAGVEVEHLRTLARETGCVSWALRNSLKG